ncbi:hypothetical protein BU16DRAFT_561562 [Lophium mytilinum]|uniref:Uncharacterized protein n=1 Tax=Lophium mytilinum TaxID=390894 RepID=A0A6A6QSY5_9PEZI|nr:hypothetical protein BU16DRAFT_561562 [Lophium mytilinum]
MPPPPRTPTPLSTQEYPRPLPTPPSTTRSILKRKAPLDSPETPSKRPRSRSVHFPLSSPVLAPGRGEYALSDLSLQSCHLDALDAEVLGLGGEMERVKGTLARAIRVQLAESLDLRREVEKEVRGVRSALDGLKDEMGERVGRLEGREMESESEQARRREREEVEERWERGEGWVRVTSDQSEEI